MKLRRLPIALAAPALTAAVALTGAPSASAATGAREPSSGSFTCDQGGAVRNIPVVFYHATMATSSGTAHRVSAWYVGSAVSGPSSYTATRIVHITFREQSDTQSVGGSDTYWSSGTLGAYHDPTSSSEAPWHVGRTYFAAVIYWYNPATGGTSASSCTYLV